jgi:superfamily II DNA/RNA helicase
MVFSATLKQNLRDELRKFVRSDFEFESDHIQTASKVRHHLVDVKHVGTISALVSFLKIRHPYLCLVFRFEERNRQRGLRWAQEQ